LVLVVYLSLGLNRRRHFPQVLMLVL